MADSQYSEALVQVLQEKIPDLASAGDEKSVKEVISEVKKEAAERTPAYVSDNWVYRITVAVLGLSVLFSAFAQYSITMASLKLPIVNIPDGLIAIGSAAIGALAGLLAPTPAR